MKALFCCEFLVCVCACVCVAGSHSVVDEKWSPDRLSTAFQQKGNCSNSCPNTTLTCSEQYGSTCPPGLFCRGGNCKCGDYPDNIIECNGTNTFVLRHYCITFDEQKDLTVVGNCIRAYKGGNITGLVSSANSLYHLIPSDAKLLNDMMCNSTNRFGALCGRCLPDHYPLAYSFNMTCIPCPHARWNWFKYIMAAYLPLTLFYIIIIYFKINTTSSHFFAVVYYCQLISLPIFVRKYLSVFVERTNPSYVTPMKFFLSLSGLLNLDFFRPFYNDFCLGIGILPTLALDYAIAGYPLFLIVVSYLLIVLYDRNYRVITIMWSPFRKLFSLFRRNWDIRTSIVDAFATFFFLSNIRFLSVSYDLLIPARVYQLHPNHYYYTLGLFYAAHITYFGKDHLPYSILAILVMCFVVILPTVTLFLYPFGLFQRFLNLFPVRWYILHTFLEPFYRCYKDGTQPGTRDYRWFASVFFSIRIFQFCLYSLSDFTISLALVVITCIFLCALVVVLKPFGTFEVDYNVINIVFLLFATLFLSTMIMIDFSTYMAPQFVYLFYIFEALIGLTPLLYTVASTFYWIYTQNRGRISTMLRMKSLRAGYSQLHDALPDRIEHSSNYPRENLSNFVSRPDEHANNN